MRIPFPSLGLVAFAVSLAPAARSQTVWSVAPGQSLQAAIDQAVAGDVLLVGAGQYFGFTLSKALTIRAQGAVTVQGTSCAAIASIGLPAGQRAILEGLAFSPGCFYPAGSVRVTGGTVYFESCSFSGGEGDPGLVVVTSDVALESCTATGGSPATANLTPGAAGIVCQGSTLVLRNTSATGAGLPGGGGAGVTIAGGSLQAEQLVATGGNGGVFSSGGPGVSSAQAKVSIAGGTLAGGSAQLGASPAPALYNAGPTPARLHGVTLLPGSGAPPTQGPVDLAAPLWSAALGTPFTRGAMSNIGVNGGGNQPLALWFAPDVTPLVTPLAGQPLWFAAGGVFAVAGVTDPAGAWTFGLAVPQSTALQHAFIAFQVIGGATLPIEATTPFGGAIR